jgi:hypothetical protein
MMAAFHTPGPWYWEEDAEGIPIALKAEVGDFCVVRTMVDGGIDLSDADARLIEAAPEHFAVLRIIAAGGCDLETARMLARLAVRRFEAVTP